ncbi:MAG: FAD synthetase family protein [Tidjanibacter sp.]|nr:FAD synthetase family protein [Tidjanibacter sp.]
MRICYGFDSLPRLQAPVVTIGSFDGVHRGHADLVGYLVRRAQEVGGEGVVVTFSPHPREVLARGGGESFRLLTSSERKAELLGELGVDVMVVVEFTPDFAALGSEEFVRDYLCAKLGLHTLVVGYNHRFGHDRDVAPDHFERLAEKYGFQILRVPEYRFEGEKISSSVVRRLLTEGDVAGAEKLLGHKL